MLNIHHENVLKRDTGTYSKKAGHAFVDERSKLNILIK